MPPATPRKNPGNPAPNQPGKSPMGSSSPVPVPLTPTTAPVVERSEVKGSGKPKTPTGSPSRQITPDDIARRAFEIYASRGYAPGDQQADWLEAERQLKAGL